MTNSVVKCWGQNSACVGVDWSLFWKLKHLLLNSRANDHWLLHEVPAGEVTLSTKREGCLLSWLTFAWYSCKRCKLVCKVWNDSFVEPDVYTVKTSFHKRINYCCTFVPSKSFIPGWWKEIRYLTSWLNYFTANQQHEARRKITPRLSCVSGRIKMIILLQWTHMTIDRGGWWYRTSVSSFQ